MKKNGILLPIFSLPNKYGIGTLGKEAYAFIDFLKEAKQDYWQMLPINPTSFKDSPYQSFSSFAGNPYFIDLEILKNDGLLTNKDLKESNLYNESQYIDYGNIFINKMKLLKKAYNRHKLFDDEFESFKKKNKWVKDYALFMALKEHHQNKAWNEWEENYKNHDLIALRKFYKDNFSEVETHIFIQFLFFKQWKKLKDYAKKLNIELIGDIPIYVAYDSADVWANSSLFELDENKYPTEVAGVPPDYFSETGQLWGNPLYKYDLMEKDNYSWWVNRISHALKLFDVIRIDHFRGFSAYYCIPFGNIDAKIGRWKKGPGKKLFDVIKSKLKNPKIIAENLGLLDDDVHDLIRHTEYPGMRILEFEFYSLENMSNLKQISSNNFIYPGTHDNDTFVGWYLKSDYQTKDVVNKELNYNPDNDKLNEKLIEYCYKLNMDYIVISMQDVLGLNSEARINTPGSSDGNWRFIFKKRLWNAKLAKYLSSIK